MAQMADFVFNGNTSGDCPFEIQPVRLALQDRAAVKKVIILCRVSLWIRKLMRVIDIISYSHLVFRMKLLFGLIWYVIVTWTWLLMGCWKGYFIDWHRGAEETMRGEEMTIRLRL
jgi:hypothetical protein